MLHITSLYKIYLSETQPFRKVHRMIDLFETIIKSHTAVMMGEYFKHNQISDTAKGMLAAGLRTPSLGTWQLFSRELYKELKEVNHDFLCNDFAIAFEALDKALNQEKTNVISFRNGYAHGATPTDEQCENDIKQFEPFLNTLLSLHWLNESNIEAIDGKVHLKKEADVLNLHPIIAYRADEAEQPFVFFNDLKNDKVGLLNYPLSKHYRDKSFFSEFNQYLPLQDWKKTGNNIFNQRIEELTETFKGRLTERAAIKKFVTTKQKGFLSIQGNPGIGKSALIAQVYKDLANSEEKLPIQLVEYFIRRGTPQAEVSYLINYLLKKTDELFPAGKEIRAEGQTNWELQQQLYNKWIAFGQTESPFKIIFLIDGLDEGVENDIVKYLPRETFKNILFMYGSRPGGHQHLDKFWGELPIEHHQKIELGGLSKEDIRALLYEVANKYEIDKDSSWIDYLQKRSEGNPLYLKLLCNAIEEGSIAINDENALPEKIDDYYKAILQRYAQMPDGDHLLNSLFVFAAARDYLTPMHLSEILGFGPATQTNVMSTLVEVLYENPITENVLDYQLFHESLREYLKKDRATEVAKAEHKIIEFCERWKTLEGKYEQQFVLRHYAAHLFSQQNEAHHLTLIALTKQAEFIATQKKVLRNFEATHQLYQYGIETATKNNWSEAAIDCGLGIVDVKYEEQNDVTAILEMVIQNEIDLALQRITTLGGPTKEDKQRQFIVIMLCIMELTLLKSKTQPWRKNAIEKLMGLMEEQIPVDHSVLKWNDFFPSYLMFLVAVELNEIDLDYLEIYKRTDEMDIDWIEEKGKFSDVQLDLLIQMAEGEGINKEIAVVLANQGELVKSVELTEGIDNDWLRFSAFKEIAIVLANQGKLIESSMILEKSILISEKIIDLSRKSQAFLAVATVFSKQGKFEDSDKLLEKSEQTIDSMSEDYDKIFAFNYLANDLAIQGNIELSSNILQKSLRIAEVTIDYMNNFNKTEVFHDIALVLVNQDKLSEISIVLEKLMQAAEGMESNEWKGFALIKIVEVLAKQGQIERSIETAKGINGEFYKDEAFLVISFILAKQGQIDKSIETAEKINNNFDKTTAFKGIAIVLANQGKFGESGMMLVKSIQNAKGINQDLFKNFELLQIAEVINNQGDIGKLVTLAEHINNDQNGQLLKKIAVFYAENSEIEKSIIFAEGINNKSFKIDAFNEIAVLLANQSKLSESRKIFDKSIHYIESIKNDYSERVESEEISKAYASIAVLLANQGDLKESANILEKSIQTVEVMYDDYKSSAFMDIAVLLANQSYWEQSSKLLERSIQSVELIKDDFYKSDALMEIAKVLSNQGNLEESSKLLEKSILTAERINGESKSAAFSKIAVELASFGDIEKAIQVAEAIVIEGHKNDALMGISVVIANQGDFDKSIQIAENINKDFYKSRAFKEIAILLAKQGRLSESINHLHKISLGEDKLETCIDIGKDFYKIHQLQNLYQTLSQLPNDEAITFFKKGIAQSISATNATEETILQILPLVKSDKESTEHLLQMHALYCAFFEKTPKEKIQKFNRSLNIQWALDIISKFPKEENEVRAYSNLEEWIEEVVDEDDRDQIELWAKQVLKGKITEEEFGERVKGM